MRVRIDKGRLSLWFYRRVRAKLVPGVTMRVTRRDWFDRIFAKVRTGTYSQGLLDRVLEVNRTACHTG